MALLSAPGLLIEQGGIKYGWGRLDPPTGQAECTLFVAAASAAALRRPRLLSEPEAAIFGRLFSEAVESLKQYRADDAGGWNMYPNQSNPAEHILYSSTIALLTLLEARAAALPWERSVEKRDALLRSTAGWLMQQFQSDLNPPGWEAPGDSANPMIDGLTLQIYAELLRAESEAGVVLLPEIVRTIPRHAANCAQRGVDYPVERAEYQTRVKQADGHANLEIESINMLWYPWAIDCSARWLARTKIHPAPLDEIVGVRRALGHLTVGIREAAIRKAASDWTYVCAESLYSLSLLPDPAGK